MQLREKSAEEHNFSDTLMNQVKAELENIMNPRKSIGKNLGILVVTIFLFVSLGFFESSLTNICVILFVIFIHEMGHLVGMKMFGYKDVQMFFIPLIGAAVSGVEKNPSSIRKAVVSLLGPVPGIIIGVVLAVVYFKTRDELYGVLSTTFLFINGFNLLPFHPLDGGRFFDHLLFSRNPKVEIIFKALTTSVLIGMAFLFRTPLLGIFALFIILSLRSTYLTARIAHGLKNDIKSDQETEEFMPDEQMVIVLDQLTNALKTHSNNARVLAGYIHGIWQRIRNKPSSATATILLVVLIYFPMLTIGITAPFIFEAGKAISNTKVDIIKKQNADGSFTSIEVTSVNDKIISEISLDENGYYHGLQRTWHYSNDIEKTVGSWMNGYWHGEWKFYDEEGNLLSVREYEMGVPKKYSEFKDGRLVSLPEADWPFGVKPMAPLEPVASDGFYMKQR